MIGNVSKKTQSIFSKVFLAMMLLAYTFQSTQVNNVIHEIVHLFEKPDVILRHSKPIESVFVHESNVHRNVIDTHNHMILDAIAVVLKTNIEEGKPINYLLTISKVTKYISLEIKSFSTKKPILFSFDKQHSTYVKNILSKGYYSVLKEPPQKCKKLV